MSLAAMQTNSTESQALEHAGLKGTFTARALPHFPTIHTVALQLTRNADDAQYLVQDTFLEAFANFEEFDLQDNCGTWLISILRDVFLQRFADDKGRPLTIPISSIRELTH